MEGITIFAYQTKDLQDILLETIQHNKSVGFNQRKQFKKMTQITQMDADTDASKDFISKIKLFDINKINCYSFIVVIGRRATGKTTLIKDILRIRKNTIRCSIVFGSDSENQYKTITPQPTTYQEYDESKVSNIIRNSIINFNKKDTKHAYLILDHYASNGVTESLKQIIHYSRHYKITLILGMSSPIGIGPDLRGNIDYTFIFKNNLQSERRKIYEKYANVFKTFEIFNHVLESTTEDYNCLAIVDNSLSNKLEDKVFYYNVYNVYALLIQKGCWNWLNKIECKDRTYGIRPRLDLTKSELFGDLRYPNHAYNQF
jgi:energy-coupling factor transporter ATP-binding protein EcfA2